MANVNISELGRREIVYWEQEEVKDPKTGLSQLVPVQTVRLEEQPILTDKEAALLKGEKWMPVPAGKPMAGFYGCLTGGRRFYCKNDPTGK